MAATMTKDLSRALFGKTRQSVLTLILTHPKEEFYVRQVAVEAKTGLGATQRELANLVSAEIIERVQKRNKVYYQANSHSPVFKELRSLLTKTAGAGEIVRKALQSIEDRITVAFLYGSAATGAFRSSQSDIDLMVIGKVKFSEVTAVLRDAEEFLGREINPSVYTMPDFKKRLAEGYSFITNVAEKPKVYLIGDEREFAKLGKK